MRRPVVLHPDAVAEAAAAYEWYGERSETAAAGFQRELEHAIDAICTGPVQWPAYLHETRRYVLRRYPFQVVFREVDRAIEVIAVAHCRRQPGYWKGR